MRSPRRRRRWTVVPASALVGAVVALGVLLTPTSAQAADQPAPRPVRVGTEGIYPPFSYVDAKTKRLTGFDVEVIKAVAAKANWKLSFYQAPFDAIFPALDANRIDVIANQVAINPERQAKYLFSTPYTYSQAVIVTRKGDDSIKTLADLKGKVAAESTTTNYAQIAKKAGAKIQSVEGFSQAAELVAQGRVDVAVNDSIAALDYLNTKPSADIKIAGNAGNESSRQALAFRQSDTQLRDQANQALAELKQDGTLTRLSKKYFGADVTVPTKGKRDLKVADRGAKSTATIVRDALGPMLLGVVKGTVPLTIISFAIGLVLALLAAIARITPYRVPNAIAKFYISAIRGTPLLVQLFVVFYGLPQVGIKLPGFIAACLALSLNVGGYAAEVIRSAIISVPRGQMEAATTIGMGYAQSMRRIVLPQAARIAVPPLSNTLLSLVKDTSLVSVVLVTDLFRVAQNAASVSNDYLALYVVAGLYFWVICWLLSLVQDRLEHRLARFAV